MRNMENSSKILSLLENLGLTENESKVYTAMLSLGSATILAIAKASEIKRTTVYSVLDNLSKKGLTRIEVKGFKKLYVAEHPNKLESMLDMRKVELAKLLPQLEGLYNLKGGESFLKYYESAESIKNVHYEILKELNYHDEFLVIGDPDNWERVNKSFSTHFIKERNKANLNIRMILTNSELSKNYKQFQQNFQEEIRLLPSGAKLDTNLIITPRRVLIQQMFSPVIVISIENSSVITMHRELFNVMWNSLPSA
jgi:sugar-specific transcriptional regulator TrmB